MFVLSQALVVNGAVKAQESQAPVAPPPAGPVMPGQPTDIQSVAPDRLQPLSRAAVSAPGASATVPLGQPGLSYGYLQTFGTTEAAYLEDSAHINHPYGLAADGSNIWIADTYGLRALKYSSGGTFLTQIGKAGFRSGAGPNGPDFVDAVKADGSGNVWMADVDISYVLKFSSSGAFLSQSGQG